MIDNLDKSFLRLKTSFAEAKFELLQDSEFVYRENIVINPTKIYTQISNSLTSIAFDDSYIVELVDCADNVMLDITNKIFINEFQDHKGIYQLKFEIAPIVEDFYLERLFLRFTQVGGTLKLWSNPFLVTEQCKTFRLEYKCYNYYQGTSYEIADIYQSIDLVGYLDLPNSKETVKVYTQLNGDIRQSRPTQATEYLYNIDFIDSFTFTRLASALNSDLVYINGIRFQKSENVQADERQGKSNYFPTSFKGQFVETDTLNLGYQILAPFTYVTLSPLGLFTPDSLPLVNVNDLNHDIVSVSYIKLWNYDTDAFIGNIPITVYSMPYSTAFEIDLTTFSLSYGNYYITFEATDIYGQILTVTDKDIWKFSVQDGEFDSTEFLNSEFFTN